MLTWKQLLEKQDDEKRQWTAEAAANGYSMRDAVHKLKISHSQMNSLCRRYGVKLPVGNPKRGPKNIPTERYIECARKGMTQRETAEFLGVSQPAVSSKSITHNIFFQSGRRKK